MKANLRLRRERELRAWSQAKVAEEVGTDPATVSRWERGLSFPYPYFRERLCALFQKSAEELGLVQGLDEQNARAMLSPNSLYLYEAEPPTIANPLHDPSIPLLSVLNGSLVGRDTLLFDLRQELCSSQVLPLVGLYGLPGVGKTSVAVQLAHDPLIKKHFCDGVLWVSLGPSPTVLSSLARWGALLGVIPSHLQDSSSIDQWAEAIRFAIGNRKLLLVIDDAWDLAHALVFKVGGYNCACLLTTRFPHIALHMSTHNAHVVYELTEADGVALLERLAPGIVSYESQAVHDLVRSVGGLPLALTLMGKFLRAQAYNQQPRRIHSAVKRLLNARERLYLNEPYAPLDRHTSLLQGTILSLQSVIAVSDDLLSVVAQQSLRMLALFPPKPNSFMEEAALAVTLQDGDILDVLSDAGLLESRGPGRYTLHQTINDYARLHEPEPESYRRFVLYYISYMEHHEQDHPALEAESNNILAALRMASTERMHAELEQGVKYFNGFLEATRHPYAHQVKNWLIPQE